MKKVLVFLLAILTVAVLAPQGQAAYPDKPITYQIPFGPGGQSDLEARRQQPRLEEILGVKVVVVYKPGGGGSVGWANLVQQKPDGYFISGINIPHIILQPLARGNAGYETEQLKPIALFQATPIGLAVLKGSKFKYIPESGAAKSIAAFLGGHVQAVWANSNDLVQHADKIRVLAFGTKKPFPNMPNVPTFESLGYKLYASIDRGVGAPPGTPDDIIKVLENAFLKIASDPKIQEQMKRDGFVPLAMDAMETKAYIEEMTREWAPVVKEFKK
ncbi:MAG: tripartite tricarboxylate transporter substrate binding protein [Desulfobacterales bacterium]